MINTLCVRSCWRREAAAAAAVQEDAAAGRAERLRGAGGNGEEGAW